MKIAVDAMGGDFAPKSVVLGVLEALKTKELDYEVILVGDRDRVEEVLSQHGRAEGGRLSICHASQVVAMDESPSVSLRRKRNSSIAICASLAKEGKVDAFVSAGNTGAVVAASKLRLRFLKGVERPAIATPIPTPAGVSVLLDAGANVDSKPYNLAQFAGMGAAYAKYILGKENPSVAILSIGEEEGKGNDLTKETFKLLKEGNLNFSGNIEGRDLFTCKADVIVTDGFVGNIVLKTLESVHVLFQSMLREEISKNPMRKLGGLLVSPALRGISKKSDYAEYGGAPLLGVDGICIICHGSSSPKAIKNAICLAAEFSQFEVNKHIEENIENLSSCRNNN